MIFVIFKTKNVKQIKMLYCEHPEWRISRSITGIAGEEAEQSYRALDIA